MTSLSCMSAQSRAVLLQAKFDRHAWRLQVIQGLDWVRQHYAPPAVVVMALGGDSQYALDMAVRNLALAGVPVVVAAGNEDTDACAKSPARSALRRTQDSARADSHLCAFLNLFRL